MGGLKSFGAVAIAAILTTGSALAHSGNTEADKAAAAAQQDPFANVVIEATEVNGGVYMLTGQGGNIGVLAGEDGVFMIDDQYAPLADRIKAKVREISEEPIRAVINTHWHFDHTGGNEAFGEEGAVIVAHNNVRTRMSAGQMMKAFNRKVDPAPEAALPVVTFTDEITFHVNGDTVRVFHIPNAHTDGDALIHFEKADVVHMGDTLFNGFYPFIDLESGGNLNGMIAAMDKVIAMAGEDTKVIPGHGPLTDKAGVQKNRDVLVALRDRVSAAMAEGKSLEEIKEADLMADFNDTFGKGFINAERIVESAYGSLSAKTE